LGRVLAHHGQWFGHPRPAPTRSDFPHTPFSNSRELIPETCACHPGTPFKLIGKGVWGKSDLVGVSWMQDLAEGERSEPEGQVRREFAEKAKGTRDEAMDGFVPYESPERPEGAEVILAPRLGTSIATHGKRERLGRPRPNS